MTDKELKNILLLVILAYGIWCLTAGTLTPWKKPTLQAPMPVHRIPVYQPQSDLDQFNNGGYIGEGGSHFAGEEFVGVIGR